MEHVIEWNDYNHNILPLNEVLLEENDIGAGAVQTSKRVYKVVIGL